MNPERTLSSLSLAGTDIVICFQSLIVLQASKGHHMHPVPELHICLSGAGALLTAGETVLLHKGDCVLIGPNTMHHFEIGQKTPLVRLEALLHFDPRAALPEAYSWLRQKNAVHIWKLEEPFLSLAQLIAEETESKGFDYENMIGNSYSLLFTHLARTAGSASGVRSAGNPKREKPALERYTRDSIDHFLLLNYAKDITVRDLAAHLHTSTRQAHRLVLRHTGQSFKQYLIIIRMSNAKHLLKTSNLPIYRVAEKVGYKYSSNFCKSFYRYASMTPRDYREHVRQEESKLLTL